MKYKASLDSTTKILTALVIVFIIWAITKVEFQSPHHVKYIVLLSVALIILIGCFLYAPMSYELTGSELVIIRRAGNRTIKLTDIEEIKAVTRDELGWGIRIFGDGGFMGYFGKFFYSKTGWVTLYATQRGNMVLIQTKQGKKVIITPDDLSLVEMVKDKMK